MRALSLPLSIPPRPGHAPGLFIGSTVGRLLAGAPPASHLGSSLAHKSQHCLSVDFPPALALMNATLAAEIERLSPAEKLLLVEELWNQIGKE